MEYTGFATTGRDVSRIGLSSPPFDHALLVIEELRPLVPPNMTMAQRWQLDQPAVTTVITGASRPTQVRDNAEPRDGH